LQKHERKYKYCLIEDYKEKDKTYERKDENQVIKSYKIKSEIKSLTKN